MLGVLLNEIIILQVGVADDHRNSTWGCIVSLLHRISTSKEFHVVLHHSALSERQYQVVS